MYRFKEKNEKWVKEMLIFQNVFPSIMTKYTVIQKAKGSTSHTEMLMSAGLELGAFGKLLSIFLYHE